MMRWSRQAGFVLALALLILSAPLWALSVSPIFTLQASAAQTASGDSGAGVKIGPSSELLIFLNITAVSGTAPTLDARIEVYDGANWYTHTSFSQKTAAGKDLLKLTNFGETVRVAWTIGGTTPSFTFEVKAQTKG